MEKIIEFLKKLNINFEVHDDLLVFIIDKKFHIGILVQDDMALIRSIDLALFNRNSPELINFLVGISTETRNSQLLKITWDAATEEIIVQADLFTSNITLENFSDIIQKFSCYIPHLLSFFEDKPETEKLREILALTRNLMPNN